MSATWANCPHCKVHFSVDAVPPAACPACGKALHQAEARPSPKPALTVKQKRVLIGVAAFVGLFVLGLIIRAFDGTISYQTLLVQEKTLGGKRAEIIALLVSEAATRQEVMKLVEKLRRDYQGKSVMIGVWDSREAWEHRLDFSYPKEELDRHLLAIIISPDFGGDGDPEVRWVAEGRSH